MNDLSKDVPVLSLEQFSGLHMAISVQGIEYSLSGESNLKERLADGWLVIAKLGKGGGAYKEPCYIFLSKPVENDDWNTPDPSEDGMEPIEEMYPLYGPYDYVKNDYDHDANREKGI